jgi:hypothetical protein
MAIRSITVSIFIAFAFPIRPVLIHLSAIRVALRFLHFGSEHW